MFRWTPYVFVRVTIVFIAGILAGLYFPHLLTVQAVAVTLMVLFVAFLVSNLFTSSGKLIRGIVGLAIFFFTGYIDVQVSNEPTAKDHLLAIDKPVDWYEVTITSFPEEKKKSWRLVGEVNKIRTKESWKEASGKMQMYFNRSETDMPYRYGDVLLVKGYPKVVPPPRNPNEFDYRKFLSYKNIYHQDFIRPEYVALQRHDPPNRFIDWAMDIRDYSQQTIKEHIGGKQEQAIVSALVLGITDGLDNELLGAYSASGAMHVLAVSGLHVGIIYWLILFILKPLRQIRGGTWLIAFVSISILWCYVFVTGMSPSVLRAATMFTFIAVAEPGHRQTNIYNTLAASALFLLLLDPFLIMSVGFQLSYLAVLGIVYIYPRLVGLWTPSSWLLYQGWRITVVSIAAQLATFSLGLLYFHQFPVYFLFSNLFVIPLSFAVLVGGIALVAVSFSAWLSSVVGVVLTWFVRFLNEGVFITESLPFSLVKDVQITTAQCWLLMAFVVSVIAMVSLKRFRVIYGCVVISLVFACIEWYEYRAVDDKNKFTIYSINGHYAMELFRGEESFFFLDSSLAADEEAIRFHLAGNRVKHGIHKVYSGDGQHFVKQQPGCRVFIAGSYTFLHVYEENFEFTSSVPVDYVIISGDAVRSVDELKERVNFRSVVFDGSNSIYRAKQMVDEAKQKQIFVHSVLQQGALEIKI